MNIEFIIHVTDRKKFIDNAIASLLSNTKLPKKNIFISCNSKRKENQDYIKDLSRHYSIRHRESDTNNALDHLRESVKLCKKEYVCLLHDDDYLSESFVEEMLNLINKEPNAAAYSCETIFDINGIKYESAIKLNKYFFLSPIALALLYIMSRCGPAFPSVVYSHRFIMMEIKKLEKFGIYSDAPLLIEACINKLAISPKKNFFYRIHEENQSNEKEPRNKRKLFFYLINCILRCTGKNTTFQNLSSNLLYFIGRFYKRKYY